MVIEGGQWAASSLLANDLWTLSLYYRLCSDTQQPKEKDLRKAAIVIELFLTFPGFNSIANKADGVVALKDNRAQESPNNGKSENILAKSVLETIIHHGLRVKRPGMLLLCFQKSG